jgi:hypothetical protein
MMNEKASVSMAEAGELLQLAERLLDEGEEAQQRCLVLLVALLKRHPDALQYAAPA